MGIFSVSQQDRIVDAIHKAELKTSGEIKVHIEAETQGKDSFLRAKEVFEYLALHKTALRNGVLIYLAYEDRKFAILGDSGINEKVGAGFWDSSANLLKEHLIKNQIEEGLLKCIAEVGIQLQRHFPYLAGDTNELPNDISFG
jgi:uncharacterized membrane protein